MARYQSRNESVIKRAFARLSASEQDVALRGMVSLAQAGMAFLVEAHDNRRAGLSHTEEEDTMAYAVARDGQIVESGFYKGGDGTEIPGDAMSTAERLVSGSTGWVAIILSDMEGWYRVDWEMDFLHYSADHIKSNFNKFFKPVNR